MSNPVAMAWLLSIPFVSYFAFTQHRELFVPAGRLIQLCLWTILLLNTALAICHTLGIHPSLTGTPAMSFGALSLLCFVWVRGTYLVIRGRRRKIVSGP